jgi:hypothetical protein
MERYIPPEARQPEEQKAEEQKELKKPSFWQRIKNAGEIVVLSAMLTTTLSPKEAFAQKEGAPEDPKHKIELLQKQAAEQEKKILITVSEKGQKGVANPGTPFETPIGEIKTPNKETVRVGYDKKTSQPNWFVLENEDGSMRFFDEGADGSINRVIINKQENEKPQAKSQKNDINTFASMDGLAEDARVIADVDPENVKIFEISFEGKQLEIKIVDFQTGEASIATGEAAEKLASTVQGSFTNALEKATETK